MYSETVSEQQGIMSVPSAFLLCAMMSGLFTQSVQGCDQIVLSGTKNHHDTSGVYQKLSSNLECFGKPVYEQLSGGFYMYYFMDTDLKQWIVSPYKNCSSLKSLVVNDTADDPTDITGEWEEYYDGAFNPAGSIEVNCFEGFQGCNKVTFKGLQLSNKNAVGTYQVQPKEFCYGRYTYKHNGGYYLFNWQAVWALSATNCQSRAFASVSDEALYPEDITERWTEYDGGIQLGHGGLAVTCFDPSLEDTTTEVPNQTDAGFILLPSFFQLLLPVMVTVQFVAGKL